MEKSWASVVLANADGVEEVFVFGGSPGEVAAAAKRKFLGLCGEYISNWDEYSAADIDSVLSDGIASFNHRAVVLGTPEVEILEPVTRTINLPVYDQWNYHEQPQKRTGRIV